MMSDRRTTQQLTRSGARVLGDGGVMRRCAAPGSKAVREVAGKAGVSRVAQHRNGAPSKLDCAGAWRAPLCTRLPSIKSGSQQTRRWRKGDSNPRSLSRSKTLLGHAFRRLWLRGSNPEGQVAAVGVMSLIVCDQNLAAGLRHRPQPMLRMRREFSVTSPDPERAVSALLEGSHRR